MVTSQNARPNCRFAWVSLLLALGCSMLLSPSVIAANSSEAETSTPIPSSAEFNRLMTGIIKGIIPHDYENKKKWGKQAERWDGLQLRREGWKIETKRRKKLVNHGSWSMYGVQLLEPDERFVIEVKDVHKLPSGRLQFDLVIDAKLLATARQSQWHYGVQLYSLSAKADTGVRLTARCELGMKLDPTKLPPDVILDPVVKKAEIYLRDFRLHEISDLRGPLALKLGKNLREVIEDEVLDDHQKLAAKANRQIEKNRHHLRLSLHDLLASKWGDIAKDQLNNNQTGSGEATD